MPPKCASFFTPGLAATCAKRSKAGCLEAGVPWQTVDITADVALFERYTLSHPCGRMGWARGVVRAHHARRREAHVGRADWNRTWREPRGCGCGSNFGVAVESLAGASSMSMLAVYVGLPFLAPVLEKSGHPFAAQIIYSAYRALCHELPQRSYFLLEKKQCTRFKNWRIAWAKTTCRCIPGPARLTAMSR